MLLVNGRNGAYGESMFGFRENHYDEFLSECLAMKLVVSMNGTCCALGYITDESRQGAEMGAIPLSTIPFAWSPDIRAALGICVAAHLHSNRVWDLVPGSQTKAEEAINQCAVLYSTYYHILPQCYARHTRR